jgi:uncharacterized RDD family membrane protein YckC
VDYEEEKEDIMTNPGGFWVRVLANILDAIIIGIPLGILSSIIASFWGENEPFTGLISFLYTLTLPILWYGYTVGKKIMGVRIVKVNGEKLGFWAMFLRTFVAGLLYGVTLGVALIISAFMVGLRDDKRGIHDLIAGTYVTTDRPEI